MSELHAYTNGYETVAAHDEANARAFLKSWLTERGADDDDHAVEGSGWRKLDPSDVINAGDGENPESVAAILAESSEVRHLWSVDQ